MKAGDTVTNEELVKEIQAGDETLCLQLWERVERYVAKMARKWARALSGVETSDLVQAGYLAMVAAVQTFDPAKGMLFLGWMIFYLKSAFLEAAGRKTGRQMNDAFHTALSLDKPTDEDGKTTLGDLVLDPDSLQPFEDVEDAIWRAEVRGALNKAIARLPEAQGAVVEQRYFQGRTLKAVGEEMSISPEMVRQHEAKALCALRRPKVSRELAAFIEERTPYFMSVGAGRFQSTHSSAVEEIVMLRERMREGVS